MDRAREVCERCKLFKICAGGIPLDSLKCKEARSYLVKKDKPKRKTVSLIRHGSGECSHIAVDNQIFTTVGNLDEFMRWLSVNSNANFQLLTII